MNVDPLLNQLKSFENNQHIEIQKEMLADLVKFRETFLEELKASESNVKSDLPNTDVKKLEYRVEHLRNSYLELFKKYRVDVEKLTKENDLLREQLRIATKGSN